MGNWLVSVTTSLGKCVTICDGHCLSRCLMTNSGAEKMERKSILKAGQIRQDVHLALAVFLMQVLQVCLGTDITLTNEATAK